MTNCTATPSKAHFGLEKAVQVQPDSREAHLFSADAYMQVGRETDAQRERPSGERLRAPGRR
jgi:Tfp pilus assembly protein PilF